MVIRASLGTAPWDVFHQGLAGPLVLVVVPDHRTVEVTHLAFAHLVVQRQAPREFDVASNPVVAWSMTTFPSTVSTPLMPIDSSESHLLNGPMLSRAVNGIAAPG